MIIYDVVCITKSDVRLGSLKESQTHTDTSLDTLITAQIQLTHRFDRMTEQVDRITETLNQLTINIATVNGRVD